MSTPTYKGPSQPASSSDESLSGWINGLMGAGAPAYKTGAPAPSKKPEPAAKPLATCPTCPTCAAMMPCPPCPSLPEAPVAPCDAMDGTVIPIAGDGPITIVIEPPRPRG
jgi:hypothetical protein